MTQLTLGTVLVGALGGMVGSIAGQLASGQGLNFGQIMEAGIVGGLTAGAFAGLSEAGMGFSNLQQAGVKIANSSFGAADLPQVLETIAARGVVSAGIDTTVYGGSFGRALEGSVIADFGAIGAGAIGSESTTHPSMAENTPGYVLAHAALGCALSTAGGTGCAGGAIGGAASALIAPNVRDALYDGTQTVTFGTDTSGNRCSNRDRCYDERRQATTVFHEVGMDVVANRGLREVRAELLLQLREQRLRTRLVYRAVCVELLQRAADLVERLDVQVHVRRAHEAARLDRRARLVEVTALYLAPDLPNIDLVRLVSERVRVDGQRVRSTNAPVFRMLPLPS